MRKHYSKVLLVRIKAFFCDYTDIQHVQSLNRFIMNKKLTEEIMMMIASVSEFESENIMAGHYKANLLNLATF